MVSSSSPQLSKSARDNDGSQSFFVLMGMNYHGAPVAVRERLVIPETCLFHALAALKRLPYIREAAILSTCNRTEVYAVVSEIRGGLRDLESFDEQVQAVLVADAEQVVFEILDEFQSWRRTLSTRATIVELRRKLDLIRKEQVCKFASLRLVQMKVARLSISLARNYSIAFCTNRRYS